MTPSEKILWEYLRLRRMMGFRFLRQHPVFYREDNNWIVFYIADFYCHELNLIIELDGKIHYKQKEYDSNRDNKLSKK
jgi:leucyl-tRNA synthetase